MVKILRKVIEKRVNCPKCGRELSFDDSDEKYFWSSSKEKFIGCPCGCYIRTRDVHEKIEKGVTLITADATEEVNNG